MKRIFLLFGIAAFSSASAQQNDLFDIQKHLQNKQARDNKADEIYKLQLPRFQKFNLYTPTVSNKPDLTYLLPNGDKVITLSQDNMPCVVPDMKMFQAMPNISYDGDSPYASLPRTKLPGRIPNAATPFRMIVSK
ncbi:MAG: hypothetical protein H7Y01_06510 [Ferruginibacter sp.]|nr:hypothetical protein [Chitinophagaceae bacterium]